MAKKKNFVSVFVSEMNRLKLFTIKCNLKVKSMDDALTEILKQYKK